MTSNNYDFIGSDLRKIREEKGITRKQIAEEMFISEETIRRIEKGENDPRLSTLVPICEYLDIDLRDIINHQQALYHNMVKLRKDINYLVNNSSIDKAKDLMGSFEDMDFKTNLNYEKELFATKHYFNGILTLKDNMIESNPADEFEQAMADMNSKFKVSKFKDYKYDEFSLRILLALAISQYKKGNFDLYRDIMFEIEGYLDPNMDNYYIFTYNVATTYLRTGDKVKSLKICDIAIANAKSIKETYYLNMIYYLKGVNHLGMDQIKQAKESFNYSLALTNIFSENSLYDSISKQVDIMLNNHK